MCQDEASRLIITDLLSACGAPKHLYTSEADGFCKADAMNFSPSKSVYSCQ